MKFDHIQIPYTAYLLFALRKRKASVIHSDKGYNNFSKRINEICENVLSKIDSENIFQKLLQLDMRISRDLGLSKEQEARLDTFPGDRNYRHQPILLGSFYADDLMFMPQIAKTNLYMIIYLVVIIKELTKIVTRS